MARFIVRRLLAMVARAVRDLGSHLPDLPGDPERRPGACGSAAAPRRRRPARRSRKDWGFDKPIYEQYVITMKKIFTGTVVSYSQQINVVDEIKRDLPATLSLAIGAGIIWLGFGILFGVISAVKAGKFTDTGLTVLSLIGVSTPVFLLGALRPTGPSPTSSDLPGRRVRAVNPGPLGMVQRTCSCPGSCCRCSSSASTPGCCDRTSSTPSTRTTSARRGPRASASAEC